jgi:hypothetical protein
LFGLQGAVTYCAFGLDPLGLNRSITFGLLRPFGFASIFRPIDLAEARSFASVLRSSAPCA